MKDRDYHMNLNGLRNRMKSYRKELWFILPIYLDLANITPQVKACLKECGTQ